MYEKQSTQESSPSPRSKSGSKELKPSGSYGSLSEVVQKAQREPSQVGEEELQQLDSAVGTRATGEILGENQISSVGGTGGISAQLWSDSADVSLPNRGKGKGDVGVSERQAENKTGLPEKLKTGIENLSGMGMDDVSVRYNSPKPRRIRARAYTQGTEIHVGPGQERYLPHEAWHVVQQKEGRVKPKISIGGLAINNDRQLEKEADRMGEKSARYRSGSSNQRSYLHHSSKSRIGSPSLNGKTKVNEFVARTRTNQSTISGDTAGSVLQGYFYINGTERVDIEKVLNNLGLTESQLGRVYHNLIGIGQSTAHNHPLENYLRRRIEDIKIENFQEIMREAQQNIIEEDLNVNSQGADVDEKDEKADENAAPRTNVVGPSPQGITSSGYTLPPGRLKDAISNVVLHDKWNDPNNVRNIGQEEWSNIRNAWGWVGGVSAESKSKYVLVKLRGRPDREVVGPPSVGKELEEKWPTGKKSGLARYNDWHEPYNPKLLQKGHMFGVEIENGSISVVARENYRCKGPSETVPPTEEQIKVSVANLKSQLQYFKRGPIVQTSAYRLSIDNINDKLRNLVTGGQEEIRLEVVSEPVSGVFENIDERTIIEMATDAENRTIDNWPQLVEEKGFIYDSRRETVKTDPALGRREDIAVSKRGTANFNSCLEVKELVNPHIKRGQVQHVTTSGKVLKRHEIAEQLAGAAQQMSSGGTSQKQYLSKVPKTSIEYLRSKEVKSMSEVKKIEHFGVYIRKQLREKFYKEYPVKFADEELNGIILPRTGAPRDVGGYTLTTPMTNTYPLLYKDKNDKSLVSALIEYRGVETIKGGIF